ncbi:minor capsid protein [Limosilactobacillus coleohominis]|uniref:minor capsid protein n=1 Tax=Limosilactobacillus coleohominis TaxID=181675 RepID=UPI002A910125|nr:minor capsid protein [Limosilactobacillus coleohominis]MDY5628851.1 minor capsid protein [Limosilactobacillus coleohominis]
MGVRVQVTGAQLSDMLSGPTLDRARYTLANQAMSDMDQFVPFKQGDLAGSAHLDGNDNIVYNTPYAKAQFYGFITNYKTGQRSRVRNYTVSEHPQAYRRWDLRAKSLYGDDWANKVKDKLLEGK